MLVLSSLDTYVELGKSIIEAKFFLAGGGLLWTKDFVFQALFRCFLR
jgi:hypothetical protein